MLLCLVVVLSPGTDDTAAGSRVDRRPDGRGCPDGFSCRMGVGGVYDCMTSEGLDAGITKDTGLIADALSRDRLIGCDDDLQAIRTDLLTNCGMNQSGRVTCWGHDDSEAPNEVFTQDSLGGIY